MLTRKFTSDIIAKLLATQKRTARPEWKFDYLTSRKKADHTKFFGQTSSKRKIKKFLTKTKVFDKI